MSFKVIMLGIIGMFGFFILFAMSPTALNMIPGNIYVYIVTGLGIVVSLTMAMIAVLLNGVMGPFLSAKSGHKNLIAALTSSMNFRLLQGKEKGGMTETKDGYFLTPPKSVGTWPNGVKGGFAYYKYGSTLEPKFVKGISVLRDSNINDIEELDNVAGEMRNNGKDLVIKL